MDVEPASRLNGSNTDRATPSQFRMSVAGLGLESYLQRDAMKLALA